MSYFYYEYKYWEKKVRVHGRSKLDSGFVNTLCRRRRVSKGANEYRSLLWRMQAMNERIVLECIPSATLYKHITSGRVLDFGSLNNAGMLRIQVRSRRVHIFR